METERFHSLIEKYISGKTTAEENAKLRAIMDEEDAAQAFDEYAFSQWQNASTGMSGIQKERIRRKLLIGIKAQKFPKEDIHAVVRRLVLSYVSGGDIINE